MAIKLVGLEGPLRGKSRRLPEGEYTIGRDGCDISVPDSKVSSRHARLSVTSSHVTIEDTDSLNGTYVNDMRRANRIFFETLHASDTFCLGPNTAFAISLVSLRPAGFWIRLLAYVIDSLVLAAIQAVLILLIAFVTITAFASRLGVVGLVPQVVALASGVVMWIILVASNYLYFTIMNGARGQTLGKMALGIKIVRKDGTEISYATAFLRYLIQVILGSIGLVVMYLVPVPGLSLEVRMIIGALPFIIMYIFLAANPERRGWYDMAADTRVVYVREE